jgi:glycosyltransferase involved in cell wall biosynthesis
LSLRALFITPYPYRSADTRYRMAQYLDYLASNGIEGTLHPFMSDRFFSTYYQKSKLPLNLVHMAVSSTRRLLDLVRAHHYDVVFVHKEAFPFGPPVAESILKRRIGHLLYDMDDAFWTHPPQFGQIGRWLKDPSRIARIIAMSDHVLAGNSFLQGYARQFNPNVSIIPTAIDLDHYTVRPRSQSDSVTIGWVGRWSSADYLLMLEPVFQELVAEFPTLRILLIGAPDLGLAVEKIFYRPWRLETEVQDLQEFDIGIMPLPDDEYSRGKCGFKMLQYMGVGVPVVVSPVGVNADIVQDGVNGFTATTVTEWVEKLSMLIRQPAMRRDIGLAGRKTVAQEFSTARIGPRIREIMKQVVDPPP